MLETISFSLCYDGIMITFELAQAEALCMAHLAVLACLTHNKFDVLPACFWFC